MRLAAVEVWFVSMILGCFCEFVPFVAFVEYEMATKLVSPGRNRNGTGPALAKPATATTFISASISRAKLIRTRQRPNIFLLYSESPAFGAVKLRRASVIKPATDPISRPRMLPQPKSEGLGQPFLHRMRRENNTKPDSQRGQPNPLLAGRHWS